MIPHPLSPRGYCDRLGLAVDLSRGGSPAIVGRSGKRHYYYYYYSHGRRRAGREMCDEAREEGLVADDASISDRIAAGWYLEAREIWDSLVASVDARVEELEAGE